ncbi:MAG: SEC-C domain-containing protein [Thermoanaerobacteraceae bacterium]|nr:SEC-C domain-containing protein [Thermoanaerobacteraceae bacterium]
MTGVKDFPCPCGSGRPYDQCCGARSKVVSLEQYRWRRTGQQLRRKLGEFADSQSFAREAARAQQIYLECLDPEVVDRDDEFNMERCFEWFIFDYRLPGGSTIVETFGREQGLSEWERALLAEWAAARVSLYEVLYTLPGKGVAVKDLLHRKELRIHDVNAAADIQPGAILFMRVLKVGQEYEFSTSGLALPGFCKDALLKKLRQDLRAFARRQRRSSREALDDYLRERSHILNAMVVEMGFNYSILPHLVEGEEEEELKGMISDMLMDSLSARIAQRITDAFLDDYYDKWIDRPLQALSGKTPRQACRTPDGRARVEELLRELELIEAGRERNGEPHYDLQKVRRKLGLMADDMGNEDTGPAKPCKKAEDYQWPAEIHARVARGVVEDLRLRGYGPGQVEGALHLWHDYCSQVRPSFRKPALWVATVIYAMSRLELDQKISQHELARQYNVAASSISNNFRSLCRALDLVAFDRRYSTRKPPLAGLEGTDPLLAQILETLKL